MVARGRVVMGDQMAVKGREKGWRGRGKGGGMDAGARGKGGGIDGGARGKGGGMDGGIRDTEEE